MIPRFVVIALSVCSLACPQTARAQSLSQARADSFAHALIFQPELLESFVEPEELTCSQRLSIRYESAAHKFLISDDLDPELRQELQTGRQQYRTRVSDLGRGYSQIAISAESSADESVFYFQGDMLVSPISFLTRDWNSRQSKHFKFVIHDPVRFNSFCIDNLERFFDRMASTLALSADDLRTLESQKLYYVLCSDETDMKALTGHQSLGMFNLAYDCVITTYNAHYHELIHQLVNFKLRTLPLYTHPFLQEGLAVALGGRGGKEPGPILNLGLFLEQSMMLNYPSLLTRQDFYAVDESLSYPLCGLYNLFLVNHLGIDSYLDLYRKFSGTATEVEAMQITPEDLPPDSAWQDFLHGFAAHKLVDAGRFDSSAPVIFDIPSASVREGVHQYFFSVQDTLLFLEDAEYQSYSSSRFNELFKGRNYRGEKYAIVCDSNEISIYNLYTNNLIANFVAGFTIPPVSLTRRDGRFEFTVRKDVFDDDLTAAR